MKLPQDIKDLIFEMNTSIDDLTYIQQERLAKAFGGAWPVEVGEALAGNGETAGAVLGIINGEVVHARMLVRIIAEYFLEIDVIQHEFDFQMLRNAQADLDAVSGI